MHEEEASPYAKAAAELNEHEHRTDAARVTTSLSAGLSVLRDSFYRRLHDDVQRIIGQDSMLAPVSRPKSETLTKLETELYQIAESTIAARAGGYVSDEAWYGQWLLGLRLGASAKNVKAQERFAYYVAREDRDRRLALSNLLARIFPESRKVPLILFHLLPLAVHVATALAFGDQAGAAALRDQQVAQLPAILDCRQCHGAVLDNGKQCSLCANPLWKWEFLAAV